MGSKTNGQKHRENPSFMLIGIQSQQKIGVSLSFLCICLFGFFPCVLPKEFPHVHHSAPQGQEAFTNNQAFDWQSARQFTLCIFAVQYGDEIEMT